MNIFLNVTYRTTPNEMLRVNVIRKNSNNEQRVSSYPMTTSDGEIWCCTLYLSHSNGNSIEYYYSVVGNEGTIRRSEQRHMPHHLALTAYTPYIVYDRWRNIDDVSPLPLLRENHSIRQHRAAAQRKDIDTTILRIKVLAPQLRKHQHLVMVGSAPVLGAWDVSKGIVMTALPYDEWAADIDRNVLAESVEYKFVAVENNNPTAFVWENRYNRILPLRRQEQNTTMVIEVEPACLPLPQRRYAGTAVPVFSLRSDTSFGVGDFGDLRKMIDFCALTNQHILQLLPINDTTNTHTWTDSYPYSITSVFALHPQYVDITALPPLANKDLQQQFETLRATLNALPQIDYEAVNAAKRAYLALIFTQEGAKTITSTKYKAFCNENTEWLMPYARFSARHAQHTTAQQERNLLPAFLTTFVPLLRDIVKRPEYHCYVQFILYTQMVTAHTYARQRGVLLKGDIPIGVSREGCDVWQEPRYFNLHGQTGAPPDDFAIKGQNWGFPTYNWDEMMRDGCRWWQRRLTYMAKFFDVYRIDHVLGFFRIWEIPIDAVQGLLGQFVPAIALTCEEIEAHGLPFQETLYTEPFITDDVLKRYFGENTTLVRTTYVEPSCNGRYKLREAYNTQRKIEQAFAEATKEEEQHLRDGLYALTCEVLFVRDHHEQEKYHPRIAAQNTSLYATLSAQEQASFNSLYDEYFYHRNNHLWYHEAMNKLPKMTEATPMLVCAEDLGMIPACVPWVLRTLGIFSLEIQSMPKDANVPFGILERNTYRSVCTISSHDTPTLRQWWDEDYSRTQNYYNAVLGAYGAAPHPLPGYLARDIIVRHLACPSMFCILTLQDWLALDEEIRLADANAERINIPANPQHYWRYRMHIPLEQLLANAVLVRHIGTLIRDNGRI